MSRKDTIIIALLINAGLLALLFMLAVNTDEEKIGEQSLSSQKVAEAQSISMSAQPIAVVTNQTAVVDEVDNFLKEFPHEELSQPILVDDEGYVELEKEKATKIVQVTESGTDEVRYVEVTVKRGDALEKIARNNGTSVEAIKKANNLSSVKLSIGQVLKVPATKKNSSEATVTKKATTTALNTAAPAPAKETPKKITAKGDPQYYTVKSGDSPWKIAKQFQVKFEDLLELNGLDEEKARNMKVGDKIRVR